jgi:FixJ family two-component response regulator
VLNIVANGETNKVIADELGISEKTVEFHRANIMQKLEARSLADLIRATRARR